jgi:putative transposase
VAKNYYSEIHLHRVWHTKGSLPLLTSQVEPFAHEAIRRKLVEAEGVFVHEIGGIATHVHAAVSIAPTVRISELIGQVKGASSYEVNRRLGRGAKVLEWQSGYGVVSFGTKDLDWVLAYIRNQPEHHAQGRAYERLERITEDEGEGLKPGEGKPRERGS